MEERIIKVKSENVGHGEKEYLNGYASYERVVKKFIGNNIIMCNNIIEVDEDFTLNKECGFADEEDYNEIYEQVLEELKENYKKGLENGEITLEEIQEIADERTEYEIEDYEFYQYFIIDISYGALEYLKECGQKTLQICYSKKLDCYILCVGHFGTSWDYVGSDFKLEVID